MKDLEQRKSWYSQVANIYTSQQRKNWYSEVADAYNKTRPRYPQQLIHRAVELAKLPQDAVILEIGCGPGNATVAFAQLGFTMVCLEPSQKLCQIVEQNCIQYPSVEITNTSFEEWPLEPEKYHAVLAATSFHWVSPEIGYAKAADALKADGHLILLWNMTPQPQYEVYAAFEEVYQHQAPALGRYEERETQHKQILRFGQSVIDSGLFKCFVSEEFPCEFTYSIDDYLTLLSTLSPYIALDPQQRNALFAGLKTVLEKNSITNISVSFLSALQIAQKM
ncbi:class I SAM-dependent methyltransferase [Nostoc sp. CMAA1605]|uniref:class I SAM-dependent methyltransferase n=1 Tax=Nostoc sp. CMAA1605 TaxID=2055159 RepID=UPI001F19E93C|nr:class I SAM-dependent methyltransferase [Nostoc sp. CMAA1605]MCF4968623.1 SAM-dependent methyltransferase [Nostoc sp. CMAA1605]